MTELLEANLKIINLRLSTFELREKVIIQDKLILNKINELLKDGIKTYEDLLFVKWIMKDDVLFPIENCSTIENHQFSLNIPTYIGSNQKLLKFNFVNKVIFSNIEISKKFFKIYFDDLDINVSFNEDYSKIIITESWNPTWKNIS
jgi:hypothetical protein